MWWAPSDEASSSAAGLLSTATTVAGRDRPQDLHRQVAEPADADDDRDRARAEAGRASARIARYGVTAASVSGAASTGSRSPSGASWRTLSTTMYGAMPAVDAEAPAGAGQLGDPIADVLVAGLAAGARAAAERAVDGDRLTDLDARGAGPERLHPSRRLVAERERQLGVEHAGVELVDHVEVGVADARRRRRAPAPGRVPVRAAAPPGTREPSSTPPCGTPAWAVSVT